MPGDDVFYRIAITNLFNQSLPPWKLAFFFDGTQLQVINAGGGRIEGGHILFNSPAMGSGQKMELMVRMHVYRKLRAGDTARTYASMVWDGSIQPACAKHDLRVIERPPVTGAGDGTSTVENLGAFLRPVNAASNGSAMPLLVWVSVGGLVLGLGLGKKFLAI